MAILDQLTPYTIKEKNTTFYADAQVTPTMMPQARISFRYYTNRYPELNCKSNKQGNSIYYDESSIHYKELHLFDDMIKKINDEKEIWPGIVFNDQR